MPAPVSALTRRSSDHSDSDLDSAPDSDSDDDASLLVSPGTHRKISQRRLALERDHEQFVRNHPFDANLSASETLAKELKSHGILDSMPEKEYLALFAVHMIEVQDLPLLDSSALDRIGIVIIGHQIKIIERVRNWADGCMMGVTNRESEDALRLTASKHISAIRTCSKTLVTINAEPIGYFHVFLSMFVAMDFLKLGHTSRSETMALNEQVSTISALCWFASLSWAVGLEDTFFFQNEAQSKWSGQFCWTLYLMSVYCCCIASIVGVQNNMVLTQVSKEHYPEYMESAGNTMQQFMGICFFLGLDFLIMAWFVMAWVTMVWPLNAVFAVVMSVPFVPWGVVALMGGKKAYDLQCRYAVQLTKAKKAKADLQSKSAAQLNRAKKARGTLEKQKSRNGSTTRLLELQSLDALAFDEGVFKIDEELPGTPLAAQINPQHTAFDGADEYSDGVMNL